MGEVTGGEKRSLGGGVTRTLGEPVETLIVRLPRAELLPLLQDTAASDFDGVLLPLLLRAVPPLMTVVWPGVIGTNSSPLGNGTLVLSDATRVKRAAGPALIGT